MNRAHSSEGVDSLTEDFSPGAGNRGGSENFGSLHLNSEKFRKIMSAVWNLKII
jgi:hypothetical protein